MPVQLSWVPPDGGWAWLVAVISLLLHGQTLGVMLAMSVMYVSWLEAFDDGRGITSYILSIGVAVMFGLGPIPAALANRFGFRVVVIASGLLTSSGYCLSYFATSVPYLVVSFGLLAGLGCCLGYLSSVAIISIYFDKQRPLAMGIGTSGVGIGTLIAAPLLDYMIEEYGWRGCLLLVGASSLNICAYGLLLRPVGMLEIFEDVAIEVEGDPVKSEMQSLLSHEIENSENICDKKDTNLNHLSIKVSESSLAAHEPKALSASSMNFLTVHPSVLNIVERPYSSLKELDGKQNFVKERLPLIFLRKNISLDAVVAKSIKHLDRISLLAALPGDSTQSDEYVAHKDDPQIENRMDNSYHAEKKEPENNRSCFSSLKKFLYNSLHNNMQLLKDPLFLLFGASNFMTNLSFITPVMYIVDRAVDSGLDKRIGAMLVALVGAGNIFGRLFFGAITNRLFPDRLAVYIFVLCSAGFFTVLSPLCGSSIVLHSIYAALIGCFIGASATLVALATADLMGISKASDSFGLLLTFMGIATLVGPPFAGQLFDWTHSYILTYVLYGFILIISVVILIPAALKRRKNKWRQEKEKENKNDDALLSGNYSPEFTVVDTS